MMKNPLVSIILPVYNGIKVGVYKCIRSLINQSYKNFEIIIIDDMSNDCSYDLIKKNFLLANIKIFH